MELKFLAGNPRNRHNSFPVLYLGNVRPGPTWPVHSDSKARELSRGRRSLEGSAERTKRLRSFVGQAPACRVSGPPNPISHVDFGTQSQTRMLAFKTIAIENGSRKPALR